MNSITGQVEKSLSTPSTLDELLKLSDNGEAHTAFLTELSGSYVLYLIAHDTIVTAEKPYLTFEDKNMHFNFYKWVDLEIIYTPET